MPANPLNAQDREEIRVGIERRESGAAIGRRIGRPGCTVNREIRHNGGRDTYWAVAAQKRADEKRARPKALKLVEDPDLADYVAARLEAKDSPMTISIELKRGIHGVVGSISHECIYQAIYQLGRGLPKGVHTGLHLKRRRRKHRARSPQTCTHSLGSFNLISLRPPIAAERIEVGHLEGDLIVGAYNRSAMVTLFDRMSRHLWLESLTDKTADSTFEALIKALRRIPAPLRRTLTWDQGSEMARHLEVATRCNIDIYFAEPKSPWQRPTNENGNALVRRYVGKGTDLTTYNTKQLRAIEHRINTIPRRIHQWATAHDIYTQATTR